MSIVDQKTSPFPFRPGIVAGLALLVLGCGSTTSRVATEQLLMSEAVDTSIANIDFRPMSSKKVYLDTSYLRPVQGQGFVNSDYVVSALRQQLTAARCYLQDDRESAEIIVEPRVGTLATNGHDIVYGLPQTGNLSQAASTLTGTSLLPSIPEISIARTSAQSGFCKVAVFAYDRETRQPIWQSGIEKSESTARSTWVMGAGPFTRGTIYRGPRFAGSDLTHDREVHYERPVPFDEEHLFAAPDSLESISSIGRQAVETGNPALENKDSKVTR